MVTTRRRALAEVSGNERKRPTQDIQDVTLPIAKRTKSSHQSANPPATSGVAVNQIEYEDELYSSCSDSYNDLGDIIDDADLADGDTITEPPSDLTPFLPNGPVAAITLDSERFVRKLNGMIAYLVDYAKPHNVLQQRELSTWRTIISSPFLLYLRKRPPDRVLEVMLASIPDVYQTIFRPLESSNTDTNTNTITNTYTNLRTQQYGS